MARSCKQLDRQPRGSQIHLPAAYGVFWSPWKAVPARHQGKFYPWRKALGKCTLCKALSLTACSLGPARWWLAPVSIASPGPARHVTTSFFVQFLWTGTFQTLDTRNSLFSLVPVGATTGWEMCLRSSERKRQKNTRRVAPQKLILQWVYQVLQQNLTFLNYAVRECCW